VIVQGDRVLPERLIGNGQHDVVLGDVVVELPDAAGSVHAIGLDRLAVAQVRQAVPFRRLTRRRNQAAPQWPLNAGALVQSVEEVDDPLGEQVGRGLVVGRE
jgi:hypothetical protein